MTDVTRFEVTDGIATLTLNRPDSMNAMNDPLMSAISAGVERVRQDTDIRVLVLTGSGRGFCAGADLAGVAAGDVAADAGTSDADTRDGKDGIFNTTMRDLADCPVPTVARINGAAAGGGLGLALACDVSIACESAFFVATFGPRLGIVPDMGATWSLPQRVGRARALGMSLLGDRITATQAADWGLIWSCVPDAELDAEVARVASILAQSSPATCTRIRSAIDAAQHNTFSAQLDVEMEHQAVLIPAQHAGRAQAFLDKRDPVFDGRRD